jgi:ABC-2 type transport system permease protein
MKPLLKSEIRKLLTVRSTYVTTILTLLFAAFVAFYIEGYRNMGHGLDENKLTSVALGSTSFIAQMGAIIAILFMAHEYRYNMIAYTLTLSNSRTKALLAKVLAICAYIVILALATAALSVLLAYAGLMLNGMDLPPQQFDLWSLVARNLYYCLGYALLGMLVALVFRNIVAPIAFILMFPTAVEGLLSLLLKDNVVYMPFTALVQVIAMPGQQTTFSGVSLSPIKGALVFGVYLIAGWAIGWFLFLRRDAN